MMNPKSEKLIDSFAQNPSSTLLLESDDTVSIDKAIGLLRSSLMRGNHGNVIQIAPQERGSIGVEQIREVKQKLSTIAGDSTGISRLLVIQQAESLTIESQNALLKLIEEPGEHTLIVLVTADRKDLADTIVSRSQVIPILPITTEQAEKYCAENQINESMCNKAYALSKGYFGLFSSYATEDTADENIEKAKKILSSNTFERIGEAKNYSQSEDLSNLLDSLLLICEAGFHNKSTKTSKQWQSRLVELRKLQQLLAQNVNTKLVYLRMCVMV